MVQKEFLDQEQDSNIELLDKLLQYQFDTVEVDIKRVSVHSKEWLLVQKNETEKFPVKLTKSAFADMLTLAGLTLSALQVQDELTSDGGLKLLKRILKDIQDKRPGKLILLKNSEGDVTRIFKSSDREGVIPLATIRNVLRYCIEAKPTGASLIVHDVAVDYSTAEVQIAISMDRRYSLPMPGEDIQTGIQLKWSLAAPIELRDLIVRLLCKNGMVGERLSKSAKLLTAESSAEDWLNVLFNLQRMERVVARYAAAVEVAQKTQLSIAEYEIVLSHVYRNYGSNADALRMLKQFIDSGGDWKERYAQSECALLVDKPEDEGGPTQIQKANLPTPLSAWSGINLLTAVATHCGNGYLRHKTAFTAGKMLYSSWDVEGLVYGIPRFSEIAFVELDVNFDARDADNNSDEEE